MRGVGSAGAARAFLRGVRIEFLGWGHAWAVPLLVFVEVWNAFGNMIPGVGFWPTTVHAVVLAGILGSCGMAGLAAWAGGREHRQGLAPLRGLADIPQWWFPAAQLAALWLWGAVLYGVVASAAALRTVLQQPTGPVGVGGLAVGLLGILVWTTAGFALGRVWPSRFAPPVVAVLPYAVYVWGFDRAGAAYLMSPFLDELVDPYGVPAAGVYGAQAVWLAGLLAVLAVGALVRGRRTDGSRPRNRGLAYALVPALVLATVGAVLVGGHQGRFQCPLDLDGDTAHLATACTTGRGLEICVHPAYRAALPELRRYFGGPVRDRLARTPARIDRLVQRRHGQGGEPRSVHMTSLDSGWEGETVRDFMAYLLDPESCVEADQESEALTRIVQQWIADGRVAAAEIPGFAEPTPAMRAAERFFAGPGKGEGGDGDSGDGGGAVGARAGSEWLGAHWPEFTACRLSGADFRR